MSIISKRNLIIFSFLLFFIIASNTILYRVPIAQPLPDGIALATLFDCMIIIPLITYLFILRKRYSLKYILPVALAGYGVALLIVPNGLMSSYSFIKYILFAGEGAFILLELFVVYKIVAKFPSIIKGLKLDKSTEIPAFSYRFEIELKRKLKPSRFLDVITSELTMFYYSFITWNKKGLSNANDPNMFTYHKKTSAIAFSVMLIHALILESVGFHFLLHSWNEMTSYVLLVMNLYTLVYLIADIQAIRLSPFILTKNLIYIQVGIKAKLVVPFEEIKEICYYKGPEKLSKEESKQVFDAVLADFMKEKPIFEIEFYHPQEVGFMYGFKKKVTKVHLSPDEPERFYEMLVTRMGDFG